MGIKHDEVNQMNHQCTYECDLVLGLTNSEAETHRAAGDRIEGTRDHYYLIIEGYDHLPKFSIRK